MTIKLSLVYVAQDCAAALDRSLRSSVAVADEILVVDGGSRDATTTVAASHGARVLQHPWCGFAAQRQFAVEAAGNDWILMLDADEVLRAQGREAIVELLRTGPDAGAYFLRRCSYFHGKRIRHGDWAGDRVLRLFDRRHGSYDLSEAVHESWHCVGPTAELGVLALDHYSYETYQQLLQKMQRYAQLSAEKLVARGRPIAAHAPISHGLAAFLRGYVFRLGLLDGVDGAAIAGTNALGAFMKYAMAREMLQAERR
ncbi:glycosyltransferase family 2 protein [Acidithiobacillus sp. AMEEHan]|uniref:glycosyltransferase family 2 protein n=1 Tax=Acidithiobacillus sp. AMEEHan TaxID=2994951 RepID=UPI0027E56A19|nr:glycosyltransferase family 2 protein [Acidithiobacillus sp. AMEEHan]